MPRVRRRSPSRSRREKRSDWVGVKSYDNVKEMSDIANYISYITLHPELDVRDYIIRFLKEIHDHTDITPKEWKEMFNGAYILIKNDKDKFIKIFEIYKKNLNFYKELESIAKIYFFNDHEINFNNESKNYDYKLISEFHYFIDKIENWHIDNLKKEIDNFILEKKIKFPYLGIPLRNILINSTKGPSLNEILYILGKKTSIERIKNYISKR